MKANLDSDDLTRQIIGAAIEVANVLKPGMDERVYERALEIELALRGLTVTRQQSFPVIYKGEPIGTFVPDAIVNDLVIVDLKVVSAFNESHIAQMLGYLAITGLRVACSSTSSTQSWSGSASSLRCRVRVPLATP